MVATVPSPGSNMARIVGEILLVAALSLLFRAYNLLSLPIFLDEATYLDWSLDIWEQRTRAALMIPVLDDGKQPLFMWLAGGASYLFPDPLLGGRMVSALAGTGSAIGVYLAGYWLVGRQVGLVAGVLYALVPFNLFYDRMALVEALLNAAGVWSFALSVFLASRAGSAPAALLSGLGLGLALGAAIWTKTSALFMLPFPLLCALLCSRRGKLVLSAMGFALGAMVFVALATLLLLVPDAEHIWEKTRSFSDSPEALLALPFEQWRANALLYWGWVQAYLPAPLWWLVPPAIVWGLARRPRPTLLLLGCWAAFTLPSVLLAKTQFESRYVSQGVFPLLLLLAILMVALHQGLRTTMERTLPRLPSRRLFEPLLTGFLLLAALGPALQFDLQLPISPESLPLPPTDRSIFVTGWSAGYGFAEAAQLVKQRAAELTRDGQPIIVLGYYARGHAQAGLKVYMRGMRGIFYYVDMHLARDPEGFLAAWKPHRVPLLVVGNQGLDRLDQFERAVPQAKRIGFFPKPTGQSSFRVYEVDVADLGP